MQFRGKALQKMREPDELDRPVMLADPRGWTSVFVVLILVIGATIWAATGSLKVVTSATGFITTAVGTRQLSVPFSGYVTSVDIKPGQPVATGQTLMKVGVDGNTSGKVFSAPFAGRAIRVSAEVGDVVDRGQPVITIERSTSGGEGGHDAVAYVFVPKSEAGGIRPGIPVRMSVSEMPSAHFGMLLGTVETVGQYAQGAAGVANLVGGTGVATAIVGNQQVIVVAVRLDRTNGGDGYGWTSKSTPVVPLASQQTVKAEFTIGSRSPINVLLGGS